MPPLTATRFTLAAIFNMKYVLILTGICFSHYLFGQIPDFSKLPVVHDGDSLNITYLINNGVKITNGKVIAWFPKDSLSISKMEEITVMLNQGLDRTEKYIKAPFLWQTQNRNDPYTFYFRHDRFIAHASGAGFISIPFWRIKNGRSPWLHELLHEMFFTKTGNWFSPAVTDKEREEKMPLWLFEGLPEYISQHIYLKENWPYFDVYSNNFLTDVDSLFNQEVKSEKGPYILSFIGSEGIMPELYSEKRNLYVSAFYHGSASFVKYLVNTYGLNVLINSIALFRKELETIENATGKSLKTLKQEWIHKLKIPG